ncbi:MAG: nucleoside 2-deoxyribosyltransferase [Erysipelotrichales bacterium]|nr:nucleoside 2-deoxyribosyltransferase [Erysipelotrichales bacterium]MBQ1385491.1 nucleoside 2-deoxyribosyltransferase [Erysipelotrichales bacterium]MBQ2309371.1 nucleoside 2-deoxyribosyltransferase [Erysipelotrichales bacterium]MBQ2478251.1 nucleoside 2-deoxyribosyltransferase [Erysipelotrichales bacterium]MBQ4011688.1 nucleoside 2-deoxyribosyltransferase [Erysipelotrichales bacterium]
MNYYLTEKNMAVYEEDGHYFPVFAEEYGVTEITPESLTEITHPKEIEALNKYMTPYEEGKKKIYMAGPLFNEGDRYTNQIISDALREAGYTTFLPQEVVIDKDSTKLVKDACFYMDFKAIDLCDALVANCNGIEVDSGTAAEIGLSYGMGKKIIAYKSDVRNYYNERYRLNNFVGGLVGNKTCGNVEEILKVLKKEE